MSAAGGSRPTDPNENRLFRWAEDIHPHVWDDLAARPPQEAAQATGAAWDGRAYTISMLGRSYVADPGQRRIHLRDDPRRRLSYQAGLVILTTLIRSLGVPPAERMVTPQELPGGGLFFQGPHAINTGPLEERFGYDPQALLAAARPLDAEPFAGGDAGLRLMGLPMVPLYVLLWTGDEEFKPRAVVGLDAHAHHHLALDGIWALTNLMVHRLTGGG